MQTAENSPVKISITPGWEWREQWPGLWAFCKMHNYCNKIRHCNRKKFLCSAPEDETQCSFGVMFLTLTWPSMSTTLATWFKIKLQMIWTHFWVWGFLRLPSSSPFPLWVSNAEGVACTYHSWRSWLLPLAVCSWNVWFPGAAILFLWGKGSCEAWDWEQQNIQSIPLWLILGWLWTVILR